MVDFKSKKSTVLAAMLLGMFVSSARAEGIVTAKVPSTPGNPDQAVLRGLMQLLAESGHVAGPA